MPGKTYRFENGVHEFVEVGWVHEPAALENAHRQLGDHGQMALEGLGNDAAESVVVFDRLDLLDLAERVKRIVV